MPARARLELGPPQFPLSCMPVYTLYGRPVSAATEYDWPVGSEFTKSHVSPPSYDVLTPPSLPTIRCRVFVGSIHMACRSECTAGSFRKVFPPSRDICGEPPAA